MGRNSGMRLFFTFVLSLSGGNAVAGGLADSYVARLRDTYNFKCTENKAQDGYACVGNQTNYILIPKGLAKHARTVFYAHGDTHVCGHGASGEDYLVNQMPALLRRQAIAVLPYRDQDRDLTFPFGDYVARIDEMLGDKNLPWGMAGHSWGGKFLARKLLDTPAVAARVDEVLLLDAGYDARTYAPLWVKLAGSYPRMRLRAIASETAQGTTEIMDAVNAKYPARMTLDTKGDEHCKMPKYFSEL
jgi:pimeloyl-ACP methyl ester carboxylesterase